ncbi:kinase-like domain-containing protein [Rhizophagus irregularis DAOM 181602=DAOM 197198]|nr:kinase-like domain-containing protein [Rhizophagus irregularis DAOM 181602=DAOM 197198]
MTSVKEWIEEKIKNKYIRYFKYDEFSQVVEIGRGGFGVVSKANLANIGLVALKIIISKNSNELNESNDDFVKELKLLREIEDHPKINRFLGITKDSDYYILVLEYANEGNLRDYLKKKFTYLRWNDKMQMALDITGGLKFIHSKEIIHRDLHSKNILVNNGKLLIADFGLSKKLAEITTNSVGVLLWEISSGRIPFSDCSRDLLDYYIKNGDREDPIDGTPPKYQKLYQECWNDEPKSRPDIEKVYEILNQLNTENTFYLQSSQPHIHNVDNNSNSKFSDIDDFYITSDRLNLNSRNNQNSRQNEKHQKNYEENNIRIVVGLEFGLTYSGFSYCHVKEKGNVCSNDIWHGGEYHQLKTNTVLQYDDEYNNVKLWGAPAMMKKQNRRNRRQNNEENGRVEKFLLHLGDIPEKYKPKLPVDYKKAITDYLREIGEVIKDTIKERWPSFDYFKNVLLVIAVPAEFSENAKAIMRICTFNAGLIKEECSTNLQFITESEAVAVYCMENLKKQNLAQAGTNFMVLGCRSDRFIDLTTRKVLNNDQLGETTERYGSTRGEHAYIETELIEYLRGILGDVHMDLLRDNGQMQYLIQQFCNYCKISFTGDEKDFVIYDLKIEHIERYIKDDNIRKKFEDLDWIIEIYFLTMKSIFEPVIRRNLSLIKTLLDNNVHETFSAIFLVGDFCESKYLQKRIKQEFSHRVFNILVPFQPTVAISRGAVIYGLP